MADSKQILLVCSSGMSTSMLVKAIQKAADAEGYPAKITSAGTAGIEDKMKNADAVLLGPQIRHKHQALKKAADEAGKPLEMVPPQIYGLMDGKKALAMVKKMLGE